MAKIKTFILGAVLMVSGLCSCTKYNYIDGGISNGVFDGNMWEYFEAHPDNWDSTMVMIEHAGLKPLFDGTGGQKQITFFGITNLTILRHMLDHNKELDVLKEKGEIVSDDEYWHRISDIPVDACREILEKLVVPQRLMVRDIPLGNRPQKNIDGVTTYVKEGGGDYPCIRGKLFLYSFLESYLDQEKKGARTLYMASGNEDGLGNNRIASSDIQTDNGVVHSLGYDFKYDNF